MFTMKSLLRVVLLSALLHASVLATLRAQEYRTYFTLDEMPDLTECLPAPPDTTGMDFAYDVTRYFWGKAQRTDPERAALAVRDATWSIDSVITLFSEPFGYPITKEETPELYKLMYEGIATVELIRVRPKAHYMRRRPFVRFHEGTLTPWEEAELSGEGSYPSGHTIRGWCAATLLTEINPAAAERLFARAWTYGESRVIVGAHWQSDVDASRLAADIGCAYLRSSREFLFQMARAKEEFARVYGR